MKNLLVILFISIVVACGGKKEENTAKGEPPVVVSETTIQLTDEQYKIAGIVTGKIDRKNIASVLKVNGQIDVPPQNMVSISAPLGGYLKSTKLLPGMHVAKGETLALLEDPQYIQLQQDYLTAKAKYVYAEQEYNRQKELNASKANSDKIFQQAQAEYQSQSILLRSLAEKLRLININPDRLTAETISRFVSIPSPINGYVSKVNVNIGKYVNPADALFDIVNPDDIHLALDVFEKDVNKLAIGQKLVSYTNTNPGKKYPCRIILISKDISADKSYEVHCHFENYDKSLLPGMFMNAEIEVQNKDALVLPSEAIVNFENKQFIFIEKGKALYDLVEVTTGSSENGYIEVRTTGTDALKDQDIVVKGAYTLLMKMKNTADD